MSSVCYCWLTITVNWQSIALPNVVTAQTAKIYRSLARPYIALATSFDEDNYERLKIDIDVGRSIWQTVRHLPLLSLFYFYFYFIF